MIGSILIGVLLDGLVLMNVSSFIQQIVIGVIIVLAVAFDGPYGANSSVPPAATIALGGPSDDRGTL